jgi:hypothetical protein
MRQAVRVWDEKNGRWQEVARFSSEVQAEEKVAALSREGKKAYSRAVYLAEVDAG